MKAAVLLALALLARAQSNAANSSQPAVTATSLSTFVSLGPDRQPSTVVSTILFLSTPAPTQSASPNATVSGNSTAGNNTVSANSTASASSSTSTSPLPTAPTTVAAGGGPNGAPFPGASGDGPDDKYIAAASTLVRNSILVGIGGLLLSGALMVL